MSKATDILDYYQDDILPADNSRLILFINATASAFTKKLGGYEKALAYQPRKTLYAQLSDFPEKRRLRSLPAYAQPESFDMIIVRLGKNRHENLFHIGFSLYLLKEGGELILFGSNKGGAQRYQKDLMQAGLDPSYEFKFKARLIRAENSGDADPKILKKWLEHGQSVKVEDTQLRSDPALFSSKQADPGSLALIESLPVNLDGLGADFGCAYGLLGQELLANRQVKKLICADDDNRALESASENLAQYEAGGTLLIMLWTDLTRKDDIKENSLDWIVMNPPFHDDLKTDSQIGQRFIETAAHGLKKGATLYMVANKNLPYESVLEANFSKISYRSEVKGFKVLHAVK